MIPVKGILPPGITASSPPKYLFLFDAGYILKIRPTVLPVSNSIEMTAGEDVLTSRTEIAAFFMISTTKDASSNEPDQSMRWIDSTLH